MSVTSSFRIILQAVQHWPSAACSLHQSHNFSAKAAICLTTVRGQLMGSVQLIILPLMQAVCTHLPKPKRTPAF